MISDHIDSMMYAWSVFMAGRRGGKSGFMRDYLEYVLGSNTTKYWLRREMWRRRFRNKKHRRTQRYSR